MATRKELEAALIAADAAGDTQAAQLFANEINALTEKIDFSIPTERALRTSSTTTPTKPSFQDILAGNFPAAKQYEAGYKQMPKYLQDPYLGLSTGTVGKVGSELFGLPEQIAQQGAVGKFVQPAIEKIQALPNRISQSLGTTARDWMQSALKPKEAQLSSRAGRPSQSNVAIETLLQEGLPITQETVDELSKRIGTLNEDIASRIATSTGTVKKTDVLKTLKELEQQRMLQVNPEADVEAIKKAGQEFMKYNKPLVESTGQAIPVQKAQALKQGTYSALSAKYGKEATAADEAQKALARGLKEEIAKEVPSIANLNKIESKLIDTLDVTEQRVLKSLNKDKLGLTLLTQSPYETAIMLADRSPGFKSLAAIYMEKASKAIKPNATTLQGLLSINKPKLPIYGARLLSAPNQQTQQPQSLLEQ